MKKFSNKPIEPKKPVRTLLRREDEVICITGKNKGYKGKIMAIDKKNSRVVVSGLNKRKKFMRPSQENPKGGEIEIESPIHISNVMYYDSKTKKAVRLAWRSVNGKRIRVIKKENREI